MKLRQMEAWKELCLCFGKQTTQARGQWTCGLLICTNKPQENVGYLDLWCRL